MWRCRCFRSLWGSDVTEHEYSVMLGDQYGRPEAKLLEQRLGIVDAAGHGLGIAARQLVNGLGDIFDRLPAVLGALVDQAVHRHAGRVDETGRDDIHRDAVAMDFRGEAGGEAL